MGIMVLTDTWRPEQSETKLDEVPALNTRFHK